MADAFEQPRVVYPEFSHPVELGTHGKLREGVFRCTLDDFGELLTAGANAAGFSVIHRGGRKRTKGGEVQVFQCTHSRVNSHGKSPMQASEKSVGSETGARSPEQFRKAARRKKTVTPRGSVRPENKHDCCKWSLRAEETSEGGKTFVVVSKFNNAPHAHPWIARKFLQVKDVTAAHMNLVRDHSQSLRPGQVAALLQHELDDALGEGAPLVMRTLVQYLVASDSERSVVPALLEIAGNPHNLGLLFVRDDSTGATEVLPLDAGKIDELPEHKEKAERARSSSAGRRTARTEKLAQVRLTKADMEEAARREKELYLKMRREMRGRTESERAQLKRESHGAELTGGLGSGNHGAQISDGWGTFLYEGRKVHILSFVWADMRTMVEVLRNPWVLMFDVTYLTNRNRLPLFDAVAFNGNHKTLVVLRGFVADETLSIIDFLINTAIVTLYGEAFCLQTTLILLDGNGNEQTSTDFAISLGPFKNAKARLCAFHDITLRFNRLTTKKNSIPYQVKREVVVLLWAVTVCRTPEQALCLMGAAVRLVSAVQNEKTFVQEMLKNLKSLKAHLNRWAGFAFFGTFSMMTRTNSRLEGEHGVTKFGFFFITGQMALGTSVHRLNARNDYEHRLREANNERFANMRSTSTGDAYVNSAFPFVTQFAAKSLLARRERGSSAMLSTNGSTEIYARWSHATAKRGWFSSEVINIVQRAMDSNVPGQLEHADAVLGAANRPKHVATCDDSGVLRCECRGFEMDGLPCALLSEIIFRVRGGDGGNRSLFQEQDVHRRYLKRYFLRDDDFKGHVPRVSCSRTAFQTLLEDLEYEDVALPAAAVVGVIGTTVQTDSDPLSRSSGTDADLTRSPKVQKISSTEKVLHTDAEKLNNCAEGRVDGPAVLNKFILDLIETISSLSSNRDAGRILRQQVVDNLIDEAAAVPGGPAAVEKLLGELQRSLHSLPAPPPSSQRKRNGYGH